MVLQNIYVYLEAKTIIIRQVIIALTTAAYDKLQIEFNLKVDLSYFLTK